MTTAAVMQDQSLHHSLQMTNLSPAEFDYTFTDKELQDILGFMEHQAGGQDATATPAPPPFLSGPPPSGLGLQFQPHPAPVQSGSTLTPQPYDQNATAGVKGEPASSSTAFKSVYGAANGAVVSAGHPSTRSNVYAPAPAPNTLPLSERRSTSQQFQGTSAVRPDRGEWCCIASELRLQTLCVHKAGGKSRIRMQNRSSTSVTVQLRSSEETGSTP